MRTRPTLPLALALILCACGDSSPPADASIDTPSAMVTDGAVDRVDAGLGCAALASCINACVGSACVATCRANASAESVRLLQAQITCVFGAPTATPPVRGACPTTGGGVCDSAGASYSLAACNACIVAARQVSGAGNAEVVACQRSL